MTDNTLPNFFDNPLYHVAIALDYLYSMGEAEESQVNNLLENYTTDTPLQANVESHSPSANDL
jgi:hypothetical protein